MREEVAEVVRGRHKLSDGAGQRTGHILSNLRKTPFSFPQEMESRWVGLELVFPLQAPLEAYRAESEMEVF